MTDGDVERAVSALKELVVEKFRGVGEQFAQIERLRVEQKVDTKQAVDAALAAAKESVGKSETSTKEQLAQITLTFNTVINALTKEINDLKDRIGRIENRKEGALEGKAESRAVFTGFQGAIATGLALLSMVAVFLAIRHSAAAPAPTVTVPTVVTVTTPTP